MLGFGLGMWKRKRLAATVVPALEAYSISSDGTLLVLTFSVPVTLTGDATDIVLSGTYRSPNAVAVDSITDNRIALTLNATPIYDDEVFNLTFSAGMFTSADNVPCNYTFVAGLAGSTVPYFTAFSPIGAPVFLDALNANGLWQDVGMTVSAAADGDPVEVLIDYLGNVWSANGHPPTLRIDSGAVWGDFTGGARLVCTITHSSGTASGLVGVRAPNTTSGSRVLAMWDGTTDYLTAAGIFAGKLPSDWQSYRGGSSQTYPITFNTSPGHEGEGLDAVIGSSFNGSSGQLCINGVFPMGAYSSTGSFACEEIYLGYDRSNGVGFEGRIYGGLIMALPFADQTDCARASNYLNNRLLTPY